MRKWIVLTVALLLLLSACQSSTGVGGETTESTAVQFTPATTETTSPVTQTTAPASEETEEPTGYPEGQVQSQFVYFGDQLYVLDGKAVRTLPGGYELAGTVSAEDSYAIPTENGCSAHLPIGTQLYTASNNPNRLYTEWEDGTYLPFTNAELVTNWWDAE